MPAGPGPMRLTPDKQAIIAAATHAAVFGPDGCCCGAACTYPFREARRCDTGELDPDVWVAAEDAAILRGAAFLVPGGENVCHYLACDGGDTAEGTVYTVADVVAFGLCNTCEAVAPCPGCGDGFPWFYVIDITGGALCDRTHPGHGQHCWDGSIEGSYCFKYEGYTTISSGGELVSTNCWWACGGTEESATLNYDTACEGTGDSIRPVAGWAGYLVRSESAIDGSVTWSLWVGAGTFAGGFGCCYGTVFSGSAEGGETDDCMTPPGFTNDFTECDDFGYIVHYGGSATATPSTACECTLSGSDCPDPCETCGDCIPYADNADTVAVLTGSLVFGVCDDCGYAGPTGDDGNGCCIPAGSSVEDCVQCGGPDSHISCPCSGGPDADQYNKDDCVANGNVWCCHGGTDTGAGVSACDRLVIDMSAGVELPLSGHDEDSQTFADTVGGVDFSVTHTCQRGHVASVFNIEITAGDCRVAGVIGGACSGGGGSVFTYEDTSLGDGRCGGSQGHAEVRIIFGCCGGGVADPPASVPPGDPETFFFWEAE